ncbi:MAG: hypothetical protein AAF697_14865 [Pseudomonadota bacterium]
MRQDQRIRGKALLLVQRQAAPLSMGCFIRQNLIASGKQIEVNHALPPTLGAFAPELRLDLMQNRDHLLRVARALEGDSPIYKIRAISSWKCGSGKKSAAINQFALILNSNTKSVAKCFGRRSELGRQVRSQSHQVILPQRHAV